jgi:hypothetical protein
VADAVTLRESSAWFFDRARVYLAAESIRV